MMEFLGLAALFIAGLSLFFTGVNGIRAKLQHLSGRRFRRVLVRVTDRPFLGGLIGVAFGAITQSASAVAFILSGMVATGLVGLRRALPVVAASNLGTALLVFLAALDLQLAVLALLGLTGIMINFRIAPRFEALLGALFAIALLFFGLGMMKQAFAPLPEYGWFLALATFLAEWSVAAFLLGTALRMVVQSSSAIGVIAIALQNAGIFTEFQCIMLICGTGPGVAAAGLFLSGNLSGPPRQIVFYQGLINLVSGCGMGLLFLLSETAGHRGLFWVMDLIGAGADHRLAWAFFLNMSGCLVAGLAFLPFAERLLSRLAPPTLEQDLARPAYIHDQALEVPETAIDLADRDQQRLLAVAIKMLDTIREESSEIPANEPAYHGASLGLRREIADFLEELIHGDLTSGLATDILALERRQELLGALLDTVHQFVEASGGTELSPTLAALLDRLAESLHLMLHLASDAWASNGAGDIDYLLKLTEDRGDMMERIRRSYQECDDNAIEGRSTVFYATTLFERMVWLLRQLALSLG